PEIKKNALLWKIYSIPTSQNAIYLTDPAAAVLDVWTFCIQMRLFFAEGAGSKAFGNLQYVAINASQQIENEIVELIKRARDLEELPPAGEFINTWAKEHPIQDMYFIRATTEEYFAKILGAQGLGVGEIMGTMAASIFDIRQRLTIYTDQLPKQIRWQMEYLIDEYLNSADVETMQENISILTESVDRITQIVEQSPDLIDSTRILTLSEINRERVATLNVLKQELRVIINALRDERIAALNEIDRERIATLEQLEILLMKTLQESQTPLKSTIDHFFWRVIQLLLVLGVIAFIVLLILKKKRA
ncbi:MAG: hypothetical protein KAR20_30045, partial [Candidatus Heimdallarchaeota archaeon]|nr:hypothetical protein [Candidatus Heimdallarchaeota archaeon]